MRLPAVGRALRAQRDPRPGVGWHRCQNQPRPADRAGGQRGARKPQEEATPQRLPDAVDAPVGHRRRLPKFARTVALTVAHEAQERQEPRGCGAPRGTATGIRTPVSAVRGRRPSPLDDGGADRPRVAIGRSLARPPSPARAPGQRHDPATVARHADVAELVDAHGSGPCGRKPVEVRVLSSAPTAAPQLRGSTGQGHSRLRMPRPSLGPKRGLFSSPLLAPQRPEEHVDSRTRCLSRAPGVVRILGYSLRRSNGARWQREWRRRDLPTSAGVRSAPALTPLDE